MNATDFANQYTPIIVISFFMIIFIIMYFYKDLECPKQDVKIIYRDRPIDYLKYLFSSNNFPSKVYSGEFTQTSPWIGGQVS